MGTPLAVRAGSRAFAYHVLLAKPVELLEFLGHQELGAPNGTPDFAENCLEKQTRWKVGQPRSKANTPQRMVSVRQCGRHFPLRDIKTLSSRVELVH